MTAKTKTRAGRSKLQRGKRADASQVVTLEMVAKEARVSPSTVSRILNGTARVRESKSRSVAAAIARLNFQPNPVAQSLARGKSSSVGVITQALASPFYGEALAGIEAGLLRSNYTPIFVSGHWREADERRCLDHLLSRRVEGIILLTSCLPDKELLSISRRVPMILTGRHLTGGRIFSLDYDNTDSARLATDYLLGQGHSRIAFIAGPKDRPDAQQRLEGYKAALAARKLPFDERLVAAGEYCESGGFAAMERLLASGAAFTAVFAANDQSAYGAILALHRRGRAVPADVSVIGFDDLPSSAFTIPPLTTVHRSIAEIGQAAAAAVIDLIEGRSPVMRTYSVTLAIRESTRPLHG